MSPAEKSRHLAKLLLPSSHGVASSALPCSSRQTSSFIRLHEIIPVANRTRSLIIFLFLPRSVIRLIRKGKLNTRRRRCDGYLIFLNHESIFMDLCHMKLYLTLYEKRLRVRNSQKYIYIQVFVNTCSVSARVNIQQIFCCFN